MNAELIGKTEVVEQLLIASLLTVLPGMEQDILVILLEDVCLELALLQLVQVKGMNAVLDIKMEVVQET